MSRDFEFKQLLRAYRNGIIDEATFDKEMAGLEGDSMARPPMVAVFAPWARAILPSGRRS